MREGCVLQVVNVEPVDVSLPSFLHCVLYVVNVEPVDLSLPSFLCCVLCVINVEPVDLSFPSFPSHKKHNIEMREGIGQPVQH
jgi:hypothetical protein